MNRAIPTNRWGYLLLVSFLLGCSGNSEPQPEPGPSIPTIGDHLCMSGLHQPDGLDDVIVDHLLALGIRRVRVDLRWHVVEPEKGVFHFDRLESEVRHFLDAGISVLGLLVYGNPWASSQTESDPTYPPDDPKDYADYVTAVVEYFGTDIQEYEIWNEPNAGLRFWKPEIKGDPVAYGTLLMEAVKAGRLACPDCTFAFGGPFFHSLFIDGHIPYLTAAQEAHPELSQYYDAMGFHPYPIYPPQAAPEGPPGDAEWPFTRMFDEVRDVMALQGAQDKPIWSTEVGWPVFSDVDQERQAAYLVRAFLHLIWKGSPMVCWYNIIDGENPDEFPPEDAFGLLSNDLENPEPKLAYWALAQLGNRFADYHLTEDLQPLLPEGAYGYALEGPDGENWWVVWSHPDPLTVELPVSVGEVRSMTGDLLSPIEDGPMEIGQNPQFLRIDP
ncbi:MAG: hypothetical protein CMH54_08790 [Myxococcales bacterium]|nr:hypothetical protein [Myxococcales bacterium]